MVAPSTIRRGDVLLIDLDPTRGGEIRKRRPCLVVSPDQLNAHLHTYIVAAMTTGEHSYPFRVKCRFRGKSGYVVLDQIRAIDRDRIVASLGRLSSKTTFTALSILQEMFAE